MRAIVTIPPYALYIDEVLRHPVVSAVRLNTVMPLHESVDEAVERLYALAGKHHKELWVDLKGRQLRIKTYGVPPFTEIELTHNVSVRTPVTAYFHDGQQRATVLRVKGNRLLMQEGPDCVVGPGESVNIPDPSLVVQGYLTDLDKEYVAAGRRCGSRKYLLSFVEREEDLQEFSALYPDAQAVLKIESAKGMEYVRNRCGGSRLMAARGDLFIELGMPHLVTGAVEEIVRKDPDAIVASRIFDSLVHSYEPSCADIGDVENLMRMGYRTCMFGDHLCMERDRIISGLNLLSAMTEEYTRRHV